MTSSAKGILASLINYSDHTSIRLRALESRHLHIRNEYSTAESEWSAHSCLPDYSTCCIAVDILCMALHSASNEFDSMARTILHVPRKQATLARAGDELPLPGTSTYYVYVVKRRPRPLGMDLRSLDSDLDESTRRLSHLLLL